MVEEGLTKEEATDRVISENLHGLEIDPRCTQIAAFNLALTAWKFCGRYKELPEMNLACSGIAPKGKKEDWIKLVGKVEREDDKVRMENGMAMLYDHFQMAPELGSLLDPSTIKADLHTASFEQLQPILKKALENESDKDLVERGVMAAGIARAGYLLSKKYTLQITNVPYLARGKQDNVLTNYAQKNYPDAKADLANIFLDKLLKTSISNGSVSIVIPQNWLFLTSYKKFREKLLKTETWNFIIRLGSGAFSQISGEVVKAILISISHAQPDDKKEIYGIDVSESPNASSKDAAIKRAELKQVKQIEQSKNPDVSIILDSINSAGKRLSDYAEVIQGVGSTDSPRFILRIWEIPIELLPDWDFYQMAPNGPFISGATSLLRWEKGHGELAKIGTAQKGLKIVGERGIAVAVNQNPYPAPFFGKRFDCTAAVIIPKDLKYLESINAYIFSEDFKIEIRKVDQALSITESSFGKVSYDHEHWQKEASIKYPNGLLQPYSDDPTQWLFHGHPDKSDYPLHVAIGRLLGYRWPAESDTEMELAEEARELIKEIRKFDNLADNDGIICIPSVNKEETAANRLRDYLKEIFGEKWTTNTIQQLLEKENARSSTLESWIRNEFFMQHCKVFHNRPFIWHIWDGRNDGFSALVNYHKLNKENLTKLIYTYLGDWIRMCEAKKKAGESGAEGLLSAALKLKEKLELILEGEPPYDIFVRWKPLEEQPIGWDPDLNDGVRLNIRPFMEADVLRKKPNIKWGIDRGKNPPGSPWGEIRNNDKHLTLAEKRAAKENKLV